MVNNSGYAGRSRAAAVHAKTSRTKASRVATVALAAIAALGLAASAEANPLPLFPFIMQPAPAMQAPPPAVDDATSTAMPSRFKRQIVAYATREAPGTIVIDTPNTYLYFVLGNGQAIRYGIGVGRDGFRWSGVLRISRKQEWPDWRPPPEMIQRQPYLPRFMAGGPGNPLGARALYLGDTVYRIHGTNQPRTIGHAVSSGCFRLVNRDVIDLYTRVPVGTKVVVMQSARL